MRAGLLDKKNPLEASGLLFVLVFLLSKLGALLAEHEGK